LYTRTLFLKIKNVYFSDNIYNMCNFIWYCFSLLFYLINLIYVFIFNIISLNKKLILINKFNKHNWINVLFINTFYFSILFLVIINIFFSCSIPHIILDLFDYIYVCVCARAHARINFSIYTLNYFHVKKYIEKTTCTKLL